ncbi:hypothetical protein WJX72_009788 [[Myrmecia] bisecta]|uniref:Insulinase family protein n=1 Tax=[Myrmecia] bisecta TaxID=41462 RepID=A0AAW1R8M6_9CHLO
MQGLHFGRWQRGRKHQTVCKASSTPADIVWEAQQLAGRVAAGALAAVLVARPLSAAALPEVDASQAPSALPTAQPLKLRSDSLPPFPTRFPPVPGIKQPRTEQVVLPNGLRVFMMEDHEVPLVKGLLFMRGGQRASPPDKVGVATISASVQRAGGSVAHPGPELDQELEQLAAYLEGGAGGEAITLGFECLKEDSNKVLGLLTEVVTDPALPQDKINQYKAQVLNILEHTNDNTSSIPRRELAKLMYGRDSVFARQPTPDQVRGITRQDIRDYLAAWERPDGAVFGISGDFEPAAMKAAIRSTLGAWHTDPSQPRKPPLVPNTPLPDLQATGGRVFLVDRPGATQATVALGEVGVVQTDPDAFALDVLNDILNSFGGRLFDQIRSKEGLAYSVSGGWNTSAADHKGLFVAGGETAAPAEFLNLLQKALQEATEAAPSEQELAAAKAASLNSFVFNFASTGSQLQRMCIFALLGIPQDYLFQYKAGIEAVTAQDVLEAAQRHLHPAQQTVVMAADAGLIRQRLVDQGRTVVDLSLDQ